MSSKPARAKRAAGLILLAVVVAFVAAACGGGSSDSASGGGGATTTKAGGSGGGNGETIYKTNCSTCHGANGEGGTGPAMVNVKNVFPNEADQIDWVKEKAAATSGPYGANGLGNEGKGATPGAMPKHADTMSDDDIKAVVEYERSKFAK